jgi:hypothetical protein
MVPPNISNAEPRRLSTMRKPANGEQSRDQANTDDDELDRLADEIADRLLLRLAGLMPTHAEPLVDAAEIARIYGKTRTWVYEHAGELGAIRLGSGPRPRLAFSPRRVAASLEKVNEPPPASQPEPAQPRRRQQRLNRTAAGAPLLHVRAQES